MLLKQRDIMIGLTSRLNERDETIINLQCELDRVDQLRNDSNRSNVSRIKTLEYLLRQHGIDVPVSHEEAELVYLDSISDNVSSNSHNNLK